MSSASENNPYAPPDAPQTPTVVKIHRRRPTDASGCLFMIPCALCFVVSIFTMPPLGLLAGAGVVYIAIKQVETWRRDSRINRGATEWCRRYFPHAGHAPIVDFVVTLAHARDVDLNVLEPSTQLQTLPKRSGTFTTPQKEEAAVQQHAASNRTICDVLQSLIQEAS